MFVPFENVPPMELGSPFRSNVTRTLEMGALLAPTKSARNSVRLVVEPASLVDTTLGFAETEADWIVPTATGMTVEPPDCTRIDCVAWAPAAVAVTSSVPAVVGAV